MQENNSGATQIHFPIPRRANQDANRDKYDNQPLSQAHADSADDRCSWQQDRHFGEDILKNWIHDSVAGITDPSVLSIPPE